MQLALTACVEMRCTDGKKGPGREESAETSCVCVGCCLQLELDPVTETLPVLHFYILSSPYMMSAHTTDLTPHLISV